MPEGETRIPVPLQQLAQEQRLREQRELSETKLRYYPMEGEDLIEQISEAEIGELPTALQEALAFREGLIFGPDFYNLNDPEQRIFLMNLFTTAESATDRPSEFYLEAAMNEKCAKEVRIVKRTARREKRPQNEEEERIVSLLTGYINWSKARKLVDGAFLQRMGTCHKDEAAAGLLERDANYRPPTSPDKGHWQAFFGITSEVEPGIQTPQREFGERVDQVLRAIVAAGNTDEELTRINFSITLTDGRIVYLADKKIVARSPDGRVTTVLDRGKIPHTIYATGFTSSENFRDWLSYLLEVADGRMDVVWAAWRLSLIFELPSQFGHRIDKKDKHEIGLPPIVNDLFSWTAHLEEKREAEWGLDAKGTRVRTTKYITHTGYPVSLGKFGNVCQSYLHETKVRVPGSEDETTLWRVWWEDKTSLANSKFPWVLTEVSPAEAGREEAPPGSYQGWLLRRIRAFSVVGDIRSRPTLQELANPEFFGDRVRTWDKIFGEVKDTPPGENPRAWWVLAMLYPHREGGKKKDQGNGAYNYWYPTPSQWVTRERVQTRKPEGLSIDVVLEEAMLSEFLRQNDVGWIKSNL